MRRTAPMKLGLCPKPRFGGNSSTASRFGLGQTLQEDASQTVTKRFKNSPSTLERRTPVPTLGVISPSRKIGRARSSWTDAYQASCAVRTRHAPIGGCLVQRKPDKRAPRGDAIQSDQSPEKWQLRCSKKIKKN